MPVHKRRMTNVSSRVIVISYWRSRWLITLRQMNYGCNDFNDLPLGSTLQYPPSILSFPVSILSYSVFLFNCDRLALWRQTISLQQPNNICFQICQLFADTRGKRFSRNTQLNKTLLNDMSSLTCGIIVKIYVAINNVLFVLMMECKDYSSC